MSKVIYKYIIASHGVSTVSMPAGAEILHAAFQGHDLCLWAEVNTDIAIEDTKFLVVFTGEPIPEMQPFEERFYVSTVTRNSIVFHVFEVYNV